MLVEFRQSWFAMIIKYQNGFYHVHRYGRVQLQLKSSMLESVITIINKLTNNRNLTRTAEQKSGTCQRAQQSDFRYSEKLPMTQRRCQNKSHENLIQVRKAIYFYTFNYN